MDRDIRINGNVINNHYPYCSSFLIWKFTGDYRYIWDIAKFSSGVLAIVSDIWVLRPNASRKIMDYEAFSHIRFIPLLRDEEYPAACCASSWGLRSVIPRGGSPQSFIYNNFNIWVGNLGSATKFDLEHTY